MKNIIVVFLYIILNIFPSYAITHVIEPSEYVSSKILPNLRLIKSRIEEDIKDCSDHLKALLPPYRWKWYQKIRNSPKAKNVFNVGLFLQKERARLNNKILMISHMEFSSMDVEAKNQFIKNHSLYLQELKERFHKFFRASKQQLKKDLDHQHMIRTKNFKPYKSLYTLMAFCVFSQSCILPVAGQDHLENSHSEGASFQEKNTCPNHKNMTHSLSLFSSKERTFNENWHSSVPTSLPLSPAVLPEKLTYFRHALPELQAPKDALEQSFKCILTKETQDFSKPPCTKTVIQAWPNYHATPEIVKSFYKNIQHIGGGGEHSVYSAVLQHPRENAEQGTQIALKIKPSNQFSKWASLPPDLEAYAKVSVLNRKDKPVCDFYPELYGVYFGPKISDLNPELNNDYNNLMKNTGMLYMEMELLNAEYIKKYDTEKVPDNVIFEHVLGGWATLKIAKVIINDDKLRHYGLKEVPYHRAYHIGHDVYLFEPGFMPKRFDLDAFRDLSDQTVSGKIYPFASRDFNFNKYFYDKAKTEEAKSFIEHVAKEGIFEAFSLYFHKYKISNDRLKALQSIFTIRNFYIPDEFTIYKKHN